MHVGPRPGAPRRRRHRRHLLGDPRDQPRARGSARSGDCGCCTGRRPSRAPWRPRGAVAVAGANGKTTTTSMLTVALQHCGADPSFAAGGELAKHGTNAHWGTGEVFVAEADESDGSFLVYRPEVGDRHQRPARPPRLLRHLRERPEGVRRVRSVHPRRRPARGMPRRRGVAGPGAAGPLGRPRVLTYGWSPDADVVLAGARLARPDEPGGGPRRRGRPATRCGSRSRAGTTCSTPQPPSPPRRPAWDRTPPGSSRGSSASPGPAVGSSPRVWQRA